MRREKKQQPETDPSARNEHEGAVATSTDDRLAEPTAEHEADRKRQEVERAEIVREREKLHELRQSLVAEKEARQATDLNQDLDELERQISEHDSQFPSRSSVHRSPSAAQEAELFAAREELARQKAELDRERQQNAQEWKDRLAELESMRSELTATRPAERSELRDADEEDEPAPQPARTLQPAASESRATIITPAPPQPVRSSSPAAAAKPHSADGEESIEDYMAALLNRMRGGVVEQPAPVRPARANRKSDPAPVVETPKIEPEVTDITVAKPVVDMPSGVTELTRRTQVREMTDLAAMRELSITQARMAINVHGKKRTIRKSQGNLGYAVGCLVAAIATYFFAPLESPWLVIAVGIEVVAGLTWLSAAGHTWRKFGKFGAAEPVASEPASANAGDAK